MIGSFSFGNTYPQFVPENREIPSAKKAFRIKPVMPPSGIREEDLDARCRLLNDSAIISITDPEGTIIYANDLFCRAAGYERPSLIGHLHSMIHHDELDLEVKSAIWQTIRSGKTWTGEIKNQREDGSTWWSQANISPVFDEAQKPVRYVWVQHDISNLKKITVKQPVADEHAEQHILENVNYASEIHKALLPSEKDLTDIFPSSFVFFKPKDIISGDFYWVNRVADETVIVLGDGTGHGVSAALISIMALTGLKYAVDELGVTEPGIALSRLNCFLYRAMNKHTGSGLRESVDMSFCRYNHKNRVFSYACGQSKIYLMRNNTISLLSSGESQAPSVSTDQQAIVSKSTILQPGDRIYMMSDGLQDQFGGVRDKRYGSKRVRELLELTSKLKMPVQQEVIRINHEVWRGSKEQTDDVSVIAFEID